MKSIPTKRIDDTDCITTDSKIVWQAANGSIPDGKILRTTCGTRGCLNIKHMYLEDSPAARRLTPQQVKDIRQQYASAEDKHGLQSQLAIKYNVSKTTIRRLLKGTNYKDI